MSSLTRTDIDIANRGADSFLRLFYNAYDSAERNKTLPMFYRSTSAVSWNGTTFSGVEPVKAFLLRMPQTKHEIQSYDCHPVPGTSPPSLLITVSGLVTHGPPPPNNAPPPPRVKDAQARVFTQTFFLVPDVEANKSGAKAAQGTLEKYFVSADAFRFVG